MPRNRLIQLIVFTFVLLAARVLVLNATKMQRNGPSRVLSYLRKSSSILDSEHRVPRSRRALDADPHHLNILAKAPPPSSDADTSKSLLHISRHGGNLRDMLSICGLLGVRSEVVHLLGPMDISKVYVQDDWARNGVYYQQFDMILVSDTSAIARIFLEHLDAFKGRLIVYVCNRIDQGMTHDPEYLPLYRHAAANERRRVSFVHFCAFEALYAASKGIDLWDRPVIPPLGDWVPVSDEKLGINWEVKAYGPVGDPWAGRSISGDVDRQDTYYVNHYMNEQDMDLMGGCKQHGLNCFIGYATHVDAFKAMIVLPNSVCKIAPFDAMQRGLVAFVPTRNLLEKMIRGEVFPRNRYYSYMGGGIANATSYCTWMQHPECHVQFDSMDELWAKMKSTDLKDLNMIRNNCSQKVVVHRHTVLSQWRDVFAGLAG